MGIEFVLLPKEITLFSNDGRYIWEEDKVLLPKEITLFSNCTGLVSLASQFFTGTASGYCAFVLMSS